jgi:hypothetical protein
MTDPWDPSLCLRCRDELSLPGLPVGARCAREYENDPHLRAVIDLAAEGWSLEELRAHRRLRSRKSQNALRDLEQRWAAAP